MHAPARPASDEILISLQQFFPRAIDLSLGRMRRLLQALGHPEKNLPPVFHIAGTNGKGSTAAFLAAIGEAQGLRVHLYTSPHLRNFHERIQIGSATTRQPIAEPALADLLTRVRTADGDEAITYFEITTAAALLAFAEHSADLLVLETGLGGRLDATNVVSRPHAAVISPVDVDHQDYLGRDLAAIAAEKGGIIKAGRPLVLARQRPTAAKTLTRLARAAAAPVFMEDRDWQVSVSKAGLCYEDKQGRLDLPPPALAGQFQYHNAGLALASFRHAPLLENPPATSFARAMRRVSWPGRMEKITTGSLPALAAPHEVWLDGGHNPHAAKALAASFAALSPTKPLFLLCAMQASKNPTGFLRPFTNAKEIIAVAIQSESKLHPPEKLAKAARALGMKARTHETITSAITALARHQQRPSRILLTGTLGMAAQPELAKD